MSFEKSRVEQSAKVVETTKVQSAGAGGPARNDTEDAASRLWLVDSLRTLHAMETLKGNETP